MITLVVSDTKTGKSYKQNLKDINSLIGKKIGEIIDGSILNLENYKLKITGGSDKDGTPMRKDLRTNTRKKILLSNSKGFKEKKKGQRKKKYIRGWEVSSYISQVNTVIVEYGTKEITHLS